MRRVFLVILVFVVAGIATMALAKTEEENRLEKESVELSHNARQPQGERAVVQMLKKEFTVDEAMIIDLRKRKLAYGDIAIILSLAQQMRGRISDINVNKILSMRQGASAPGWGEISDKLGLKLWAVASQVAGVQREVREDIKKAQNKEYETVSELSYERQVGSWARRGY